MNPTSIARHEGAAQAAVRDPIDQPEARLWDRARLNLMLLYGGCRGSSNPGQSNPSKAETSPFGDGTLEM